MSGTYVLALDPGKSVGWARSDGTCGTVDLREPWDRDMAEAMYEWEAWLDEALKGARLLVIERPMGRVGTTDIPNAIALIAHMRALKAGVMRKELTVPAIRKEVLGKGNAPKAQVRPAVEQLGYAPRNLHEADACAVLEATLRLAVKDAAPGAKARAA